MLSRFVAIALMLLVPWAACTKKEDSGTPDPGGPVAIPPISRDVVDAGLVILNLDADVYGPGGSPGIDIPDAGPRPDLARALDASVDAGGMGAACDVFALRSCATGLGCYPKTDGTGTCQQAGYLPGGSNCEPNSSSPDSRCAPGYFCVVGICTALCHFNQATTGECSASIGISCVRFGTSTTVGYCASD
jgi:hypothetical protein